MDTRLKHDKNILGGATAFVAATQDAFPAFVNGKTELGDLKTALSAVGSNFLRWGVVKREDTGFAIQESVIGTLGDDTAKSLSDLAATLAGVTQKENIRALAITHSAGEAVVNAVADIERDSLETTAQTTKKLAAGAFLREAFITRASMKARPGTLFIFGDNMARAGFGGQAKEMRGEPNAVGIPTKKAPRRDDSAYFTDADFNSAVKAITPEIERLKTHISSGGDIVYPAAGIGTDRAELPQRAPKIHAYIQEQIAHVAAMAGTREQTDERSERRTPDADVIEVFNKKNMPRGAGAGTIVDISRYGTLRFGNDTKPTLGNPFVMNEYRGRDGSREDVVQKYAAKLAKDFEREGFKDWFTETMKGKTGVACFCAPALCHGDVIKAAGEAIRSGKDPLEAIKPFVQDPVAAKAARDTPAAQPASRGRGERER